MSWFTAPVAVGQSSRPKGLEPGFEPPDVTFAYSHDEGGFLDGELAFKNLLQNQNPVEFRL